MVGIRAALFVLCSLAALVTVPALAADWSLDKDKDGVTVWSRAVAGSDYREYKVQLKVSATPDQVWAALIDFGGSLPPRVAAQKVVSRTGNSLVVYQREDCSPLKDREYVMRVTLQPDSRSLSAEVATDLAPSTEDLIRVPAHRHTWTVTADGEDAVATMVMHHDPVGVMDSLYHRGVIGNMSDLRDHIQRQAQSK